MSKDDYFVLVYRILTYLYYCLKEGIAPDMEYLTFNTKYFPICESYWEYIIDINITPKGIEYLTDNSNMQKAKDFLKSIKEIVPFI